MEQVESSMLARQVTTPEAGYKRVDEFRQVIRDTEVVTQELFEGANKRIEGAKPVLEEIERQVTRVLALVALAVLALAALIAVVIARSITVPVGEADRVPEAPAPGRLTPTLHGSPGDAIGRLQQSPGRT